MTTERKKNERNMVFFKQPLSRLDTYYVLLFNEDAMVMCWDDGERWRASLMGAKTNGTIVSATGRTPREALRRLEQKTLVAIRGFVSTFALVFREAGLLFKKALTGK